MAETYYFRLPFYLTMATTERSVDITFDNTIISTADITSTDVTSPTNVSFAVTKDPGTYVLKITPVPAVSSDFGFTTVSLDDVWVSNDNVNYFSILRNYYPSKRPLVKTPDDVYYGFSPAIGAIMYNDTEFTVEIDLPDNANWGNLYNDTTIETMKTTYEYMNANNLDSQVADSIKEAYDFFKARGYS